MSVFAFRLVLTSEPQQLPKVTPRYGQVRLSTPSGNSGSVYLSASPANAGIANTRFAIPANVRFPFKVSDLGLLYASGTTSDALDLLCETKGGDNEPSNGE